MAEWLAERLRTLAPDDLAGVPLYAMLASELPPGYLADDQGGVAGRYLDLTLQSELEAKGQWQGRGRALIVDNFHASAVATDWNVQRGTNFAESRDTIANSIAIHELAHTLVLPVDLTERDHNAERELTLQVNAIPSAERVFANIFPKWHHHEAKFIRCLCHLAGRAVLAGWQFAPEVAWDHEHYGLSPLTEYAAALGDELHNIEATIGSILAKRPPQAFIDLWQADLYAWAEANDKPHSAIAAHMDNFPAEAAQVHASLSLAPLQIGDEVTDEGVMILATAGTTRRGNGPSHFRTTVSGVDGVITMAGQPKLLLDGKHVGHVDAVDRAGEQTTIRGKIYRTADKHDEIVESARNGFIWQPHLLLTAGKRLVGLEVNGHGDSEFTIVMEASE